MIITAGWLGEQPCWSELWTRFSARTAWRAGYRATRPKVERKIGHLMRRRHGGRRARVRGLVNLARLGVLRVAYRNGARVAASR